MRNVVEKLGDRSWRTEETHERYVHDRTGETQSDICPLCDDRQPIQAFIHWKIIPNKYPYDAVADVHHMIIPYEHCTEEVISQDAWQELQTLKRTVLNDTYKLLFEALPGAKSVPGHFHLHLILPKVIN